MWHPSKGFIGKVRPAGANGGSCSELLLGHLSGKLLLLKLGHVPAVAPVLKADSVPLVRLLCQGGPKLLKLAGSRVHPLFRGVSDLLPTRCLLHRDPGLPGEAAHRAGDDGQLRHVRGPGGDVPGPETGHKTFLRLAGDPGTDSFVSFPASPPTKSYVLLGVIINSFPRPSNSSTSRFTETVLVLFLDNVLEIYVPELVDDDSVFRFV